MLWLLEDKFIMIGKKDHRNQLPQRNEDFIPQFSAYIGVYYHVRLEKAMPSNTTLKYPTLGGLKFRL